MGEPAAAIPFDSAPPHSVEVEQSVLGALLIDNNAFGKIAGVIAEEDFCRDDHRRIFRHIARLLARGSPADVVTVAESIKASEDKDKSGGFTYLAALAGNTPSAQNIAAYAAVVVKHAQLRRLFDTGVELTVAAKKPGADPQAIRQEIEEKLSALGAADRGLSALDLVALGECEPVAPRHIVPAWLPAGEVTLLSGHGGSGKSVIALHLAMCIALGRPWHGLPVEQRRVTYLSAEDRAKVLHWRLTRIARYLGAAMVDLAGLLEVVDVSGSDAELMRDTRDGPELTPLYGKLRGRSRNLIVLDGASDLYGCSEIIRPHVRRFIRAVRSLTSEEGAVLVVGHIDKAAARGKESGDRYSGSTAWHNSVRARWSLVATGQDALVLELAKANNAAAGAELRLRWDADAHVYVADEAPAQGGIVGAIKERQIRDGVLAAMRACAEAGIAVPAAMTGPRTAYHVLRAQATFPADLAADSRAARRRFWAAIEDLRASRAIEELVIRAQHRHAVATLVLLAGAS